MEWLTPELIRTARVELAAGGVGAFVLLVWYIGCKHGLPWRKK